LLGFFGLGIQQELVENNRGIFVGTQQRGSFLGRMGALNTMLGGLLYRLGCGVAASARCREEYHALPVCRRQTKGGTLNQ